MVIGLNSIRAWHGYTEIFRWYILFVSIIENLSTIAIDTSTKKVPPIYNLRAKILPRSNHQHNIIISAIYLAIDHIIAVFASVEDIRQGTQMVTDWSMSQTVWHVVPGFRHMISSLWLWISDTHKSYSFQQFCFLFIYSVNQFTYYSRIKHIVKLMLPSFCFKFIHKSWCRCGSCRSCGRSSSSQCRSWKSYHHFVNRSCVF